jgi:hypothetical protein
MPKERVELVDLVEEGACTRVHLASFGTLWIVERINFPTFSWMARTLSCRLHRISQKASGLSAPGKRQAILMTAIGSAGLMAGMGLAGLRLCSGAGWLASAGAGTRSSRQQIFGQGSNGRVFENNCCRDFGRRGAFQAAAQLHRHQRIHAEIW